MRQLLFSVGAPRGAPVHANGYIMSWRISRAAREWDSHNGPPFGTAPTKRSHGPRLTANC